ncbi:clumping factor A isoform X4 [Bactrocera oleae]|uniref:clumping factor A isoform X4 n=1 Tax=Bactrocera oleae TaxID=104688 RepID=UPI00387E38F0
MDLAHEVCQFCQKVEFKYTCPKCSALYCSKICFRKPGHKKCTSLFHNIFRQSSSYSQMEHNEVMMRYMILRKMLEVRNGSKKERTKSESSNESERSFWTGDVDDDDDSNSDNFDDNDDGDDADGVDDEDDSNSDSDNSNDNDDGDDVDADDADDDDDDNDDDCNNDVDKCNDNDDDDDFKDDSTNDDNEDDDDDDDGDDDDNIDDDYDDYDGDDVDDIGDFDNLCYYIVSDDILELARQFCYSLRARILERRSKVLKARFDLYNIPY